MPRLTVARSLNAGTLSGQIYYANTGSKNCPTSSVPVYFEHINADGSTGIDSGAITAKSFTAGQQPFIVFNTAHATDNRCAGVKIYYNSGTYQTTVTFPGWTGGGSSLVT